MTPDEDGNSWGCHLTGHPTIYLNCEMKQWASVAHQAFVLSAPFVVTFFFPPFW